SVTIRGHTWQVELAVTPEQRYRGLSNRKELPAGRGMLFVFETPQVLEFCMRQCLIPLDIAFIDENLRVVKTCTMAVEPYGFERAVYSSDRPAQYALEVPAGSLAAAGVAVGDTVRFSGIEAGAAKALSAP
ncbi:MAG: DUF192 domain-containing protein, partial [Planctomycetes bacterium]|nr:DUF192 domain-containing protein [Planctomycetota bacterium]